MPNFSPTCAELAETASRHIQKNKRPVEVWYLNYGHDLQSAPFQDDRAAVMLQHLVARRIRAVLMLSRGSGKKGEKEAQQGAEEQDMQQQGGDGNRSRVSREWMSVWLTNAANK